MPRLLLVFISLLFGVALSASGAAAGPLKVCVTTTDLASIVRTIGGDEVTVTAFCRGTDDPHFLDARPSFIKAASEADLLVEVGLELESGWVPPIVTASRNPKIQAGASGRLDASAAIEPLDVPSGPVDRSMGDVHAAGNPHYLADPLAGLEVATLVAKRLAELRPEAKAGFDERLGRFRAALGAALVGPSLAAKYDPAKLALLAEHGKLAAFLETQHDAASLGGWLGELAKANGAKVVCDHRLWSYFARRFGLVVIGELEPKPGVAPTTKHLQEIIELMRRDHATVILATPYFDPRHAAFVAEATHAKVAALAHQCGALPGTDDYLAMVDHNVKAVAAAAAGTP